MQIAPGRRGTLEGATVQMLLAKGTEGAPGNPRIVSHVTRPAIKACRDSRGISFNVCWICTQHNWHNPPEANYWHFSASLSANDELSPMPLVLLRALVTQLFTLS